MAVTIQDPNTWKVIEKANGTTTSASVWTLAADGKAISGVTKGTKPDGSDFENDWSVKRVGGTGGFAGTWRVEDLKLSSPARMQIEASGADALNVSIPDYKMTMTLNFDGKESPVEGPTVLKGSTVSAKRISAHKIQLIDKLNGKEMDTTEWEISSDGKVLKMVEHDAGEKKPIVSIYDRQ